MQPFGYDPRKTEELAAPLDEIQIDAAQKQLIRDLADAIGPAIGLDPIPCHGVWLRAVRAWQVDKNAPASSITKMDPARRAQAALELRDRFIALVSEMLRSPAQAAALTLAIEDAYALYLRKYNRRPGSG